MITIFLVPSISWSEEAEATDGSDAWNNKIAVSWSHFDLTHCLWRRSL